MNSSLKAETAGRYRGAFYADRRPAQQVLRLRLDKFKLDRCLGRDEYDRLFR